VRFVGVDLAWGGRNPSGLAALDPAGRVVAEGSATARPGPGHRLVAIEVFPHPAIVELGGLSRALRYKKGPPEARRAGLRALALVLAGLAAADPPLRLDADRLLARELLVLSDRRGQALKAVEDLADAHVCAYVALWWWWHGPAASLVAGNDATGAIVVPLPARR